MDVISYPRLKLNAVLFNPWWHHQMETFPALLVICAGNSPVPGEFPTQRPVPQGFDVIFDLRPNKRLSKLWRCCWFETPSRPLWRHCNVCQCSSLDFDFVRMTIGIAFKHTDIDSLRPRQNCRHFADDSFKCIFLNENVWIAFKISLKFIPKFRIKNIPTLVKIMAWRQPYLNQWWLIYWREHAWLGPNEIYTPVQISYKALLCTLKKTSSIWQLFRYWWHRKLS